MNVLGWAVFFVALLVSVMLHEAGHFVTAKRFGMKATQFFVGFGPTLWSRMKGETEYGIKAIPAGGFVKIVGMTPLEDVDPADEPRAFYRQKAVPRAIVLAAGSFMHFVIAFVLLLVIAMGLGLPDQQKPTTTVGSVSACVPASDTAPCKPGDPVSPARRAGLREGDEVVAFAGHPVHSWEGLAAAIRSHGPGPADLTVIRGGRRVTLHADLVPAKGHPGSFLGMGPQLRAVRLGPAAAVVFSGRAIGSMLNGVGQVLADLPAAIPKLFSPQRADTPGGSVGSIIGAARYSGEVLAADTSWSVRVSRLLVIVVSLNVFVGAFNMLPLLPLDGGHLAVLLYERARAWIARLRGRPDPGMVDMRKLLPATYVVFVLLIGLGMLLVLADIVNPLSIQ